MINAKNWLIFVFITYPIGIFLGFIFNLSCLFGRIKVCNWKRFPHWQRRILLISNHPSLLEPFILPALFLREFFFRPFSFRPWSAPDLKNFYDKWFFFWIRPVSIPVSRNEKESVKALFQVKNLLLADRVVIFHPEGGRTCTGEEFIFSKTGKRIRKLKDSVGWLVHKADPLIVPVWVEGTDKVFPNTLWVKESKSKFPFPRFWEKITIKIGVSVKLGNPRQEPKEEITEKLAKILLDLADEE